MVANGKLITAPGGGGGEGFEYGIPGGAVCGSFSGFRSTEDATMALQCVGRVGWRDAGRSPLFNQWCHAYRGLGQTHLSVPLRPAREG